MKELYNFAKDVAVRAGKITLKFFRSEISVEFKPDYSPVTIADRETEEFIRKEIEKRFPDDGIIGEEFGEKKSRSGYRWILDPIDGTKSFICGLPHYGTMIALEKDGESLIGVIHYPPFQETISGLKGYGSYFNEHKCKIKKTVHLKDAQINTSDLRKIQEKWGLNFLQTLIKNSYSFGTYDCYNYALLATGRADAFIEYHVHIWDAAPLFPIFGEAGCCVTDDRNNSNLQIENLVLAVPSIHHAILKLINKFN